MNKKTIDKLIPDAFNKISSSLLNSDKTVDKVYASYLSALGPTIRYAGLLQTILFYEGDSKKKKVIDVVKYILQQNNPQLATSSLSGFLQQGSRHSDRRIRIQVLEAVVAAKLSIRTFPYKKDMDTSQGGS